jgi:hypothetical protein
MTSVHVELMVEGVAVIGLSEPTLCLSLVHEPRGSSVMALSVVVLPSSDDEAVFP